MHRVLWHRNLYPYAGAGATFSGKAITSVAERVGFEPTKEGSLSVFKTDSISHSDTPPCCRTKMCGGDISMINTICVEMRSRLELQAEGHRCRYWIDT